MEIRTEADYALSGYVRASLIMDSLTLVNWAPGVRPDWRKPPIQVIVKQFHYDHLTRTVSIQDAPAGVTRNHPPRLNTIEANNRRLRESYPGIVVGRPLPGLNLSTGLMEVGGGPGRGGRGTERLKCDMCVKIGGITSSFVECVQPYGSSQCSACKLYRRDCTWTPTPTLQARIQRLGPNTGLGEKSWQTLLPVERDTSVWNIPHSGYAGTDDVEDEDED
jgi:hypothetical protein